MAAAALLLPLLPAGPSATAQQPRTGTLQGDFAAAAAQYHVPLSVLLGVSYLQSRWDSHHGAPSVSGGYGPMHLTDTRTALAEAPRRPHPPEDARGDAARALPPVAEASRPEPAVPGAATPRGNAGQDLARAARLTGLPAELLRTSAPANVRGGAALLAAAQRELGEPSSSDPADWYGAVARFSGADDAATARTYADDVYAVIRNGERRTTDSGQQVTLRALPRVAPDTAQAARLGLRTAPAGRSDCPATVACEWIPAPYKEFGTDDYGNHDKADRPTSQSVDYIVIHDTEARWAGTIQAVQDPAYLSWHYSLRSSDGHAAQHLALKDVGWHAGNWYINAKSLGLEHEGFLAAPDAWFTEAMYRASARLVVHLAKKFSVPLDRQHILGHDNVPGTTTATIPGMHEDPGPYWDWAHYFQLLGKPFTATAGAASGVVTIAPGYSANKPSYTGCVTSGARCAAHGSGAVRLFTSPDENAPLVQDIGTRPGGQSSTTDVYDVGARGSTGQQYAVAERKGDWTAIWFLGRKAWFRNPAARPTALGTAASVLTPKAGAARIPVYGRAYPEASAYPKGVPVQPVPALPYKLLAGQRYVVGGRMPGEYLYAPTFATAGHRVVRGKQMYYEIQFGHRIAYVKASDVRVVAPGK